MNLVILATPQSAEYANYHNPEYLRYMGFGKLLVQASMDKYDAADSASIIKVANDPEIVRVVATHMTPDVPRVFWSFRIMVFIGFFMFSRIIVGLILLARQAFIASLN